MSTANIEGPCASCPQKHCCSAYNQLKQDLFSKASFIRPSALDSVDIALDEFVVTYMGALDKLVCDGRLKPDWKDFCLAAAFDLAVTAIYTTNLITEDASFVQKAFRSGQDTAYFPYTWMCPKRVSEGMDREKCNLPDAVRRGPKCYPNTDLLAKPGGRMIGDVGIKVLKSIFRMLLKRNGHKSVMRDGGGFRGEFDLTIIDETFLIFIEVNAKPLVCYRLRLELFEPAGEELFEWQSVAMEAVKKLSLFMGATREEIPLSRPSSTDLDIWPIPDLTNYVANPENLARSIENWSRHIFGNRKWEGEDPQTRWVRFGCGNFSVVEDQARVEKRVANTKELPGLDRTDDIKKGAAQLLKFARLKFECPEDRIACILAGNTWAETHDEHYVEPMLRLKIRRGDVQDSGEEWIFDAVLGLTRNEFNREELREYFSLDI